MPKKEDTITQKQLREIFDGAAGVTDDGVKDAGSGVAAIRAMIDNSKINRNQARNLFAWYAEHGYTIDEGWAMLADIPSRRGGVSSVTVGSKVPRKLHAGKNGRKGIYLPMGLYLDSDDVVVSYAKNRVTISGIEVEGDEA